MLAALTKLRSRVSTNTALIGDADPSARRHAGSRPSVLAIHGYGGTPFEVDLVVEVARELERETYAPRLPGHGTDATDLARTGWHDWSRAAEAALDGVASAQEPAVVCGLSLGSVLATHLAVTYPDKVRGLVLLANALWLYTPAELGLTAIRRLRVPDFQLPKVGADITDPASRRNHLTYGTQPVHAATEVLRGARLTRARLSEVRCPTLLVHGARDKVVPPANARRVAQRLGTRDWQVLMLPRSAHIVTRDVERHQVGAALRRFVEEL